MDSVAIALFVAISGIVCSGLALYLFLLSRADKQFWLNRILATRRREHRDQEPTPTAKETKKGDKTVRKRKAVVRPPKCVSTHDHPRLIRALKGFTEVGIKKVALKRGRALFSMRDGNLRLLTLGSSADIPVKCPTVKISDRHRGYDCADFGSEEGIIWAVKDHEMELVKIRYSKNGATTILTGETVPQDVLSGISACSAPFVFSFGANKDTSFSLFDLSGRLVKTYNTSQIENNGFAVGGQLVGAAAWSAGIQLYTFNLKEAATNPLRRALMLPTTTGADCLAINASGSRAVVVDKKWRLQLYLTDKFFGEKERGKLLRQADLPGAASQVVFSHDAELVIVAVGRDIEIRDAETLDLLDRIPNAHKSAVRTLTAAQDAGIFCSTCVEGQPKIWLA